MQYVSLFFILIVQVSLFSSSFNEVNDGFRQDPQGKTIYAYDNKLPELALSYQEKIIYLKRKVFGLGQHQNLKNDQVAAFIPSFEIEILSLYLEISNSNVAKKDIQILQNELIRLYSALRFINEYIFEDTVRVLDVKFPGSNGVQLPEDNKVNKLYHPNYRKEFSLPEAEQAVLFSKMHEKFLASGGSQSEMFLLNLDAVKSFGKTTYLEYVQLQDKSIIATFGKAGHILLARGKPVLAAGQIVILKDNTNTPILIIITNASGSYKPDLLQVSHTANDLINQLGFGPIATVVTKGEPLSSQLLKLLIKAEESSAHELLKEVNLKLKHFFPLPETAKTNLSNSINFCGSLFL